jgi:hypothetical protein
MEEFFTQDVSSKGKKLPLYLPNGDKSKDWLVVRGSDSSEFKLADIIGKRETVQIAQIKDPQMQAEAVRASEVKAIASLVADWSFPKECNQSNVITFLTKAPQIADAVNRYAGARTNFFEPRSQPLKNGIEVS